MGRFFSFILLVSLINCNQGKSNEHQNGKLKIVLKYCKHNNDKFFLSEFKLFKNKKLIKETGLDDKKTTFSNLAYGTYDIEYVSIFNKIVHRQVTIDGDSPKNMELCVDHLNYKANTNVLFLDKMKVGETLVVHYQSRGCFSFSEKELKITKKPPEKFVARYNGKDLNLSASQIELVRQFEIELRSNHSGLCSTVDKYSLYNPQSHETYVVNDRSCTWRGFDSLIEKLGLKT